MLVRIRPTLLHLALGATLALTIFAGTPVRGFADTASDLAAAKADLARYAANYAAKYDKVTRYTEDLEVTKSNLEDNARQVKSKMKALKSSQERLASHISGSYKTGGITLASILFGSSSLNDMISNMYYIDTVSKSQADEIGRIKRIKSELEADRQRTEDLEKNQKSLLAAAEKEAQAAEAERAGAQRLVSSLDANLQAEIAAQAAKDEALQQVIGGGTDSKGSTPTPPSPGPDPSPNPKPNPNPKPDPGHGTGSYIETAKQFIGTPYLWGGTTPSGFDCSGLVWYAYHLEGVTLPRTATAQCAYIKQHGRFTTDKSQLQYGDLVFFYQGGGPTMKHVGFYAGGDSILNATQEGDTVRITRLSAQTGFAGGGQL